MMRASWLDRRARKEARYLVREARTALSVKRGLRGKAGDLESATSAMEAALGADDALRVRRSLPALDALVDELIRRQSKSTTRDYIESIGAAVLIALALRAFVVEAFKIPSSSMYPTLEIGDHIFVNKFIYGVRIPWTTTKLFELRDPKRGEVVVFIYPCEPDRDYIKRVVAVAGDTVETRCGVLYVNGEPVTDTFVDEESYRDYDENTEQWYPYPTTVARFGETVLGHPYHVFGNPDRVNGGDPKMRNFPRGPIAPGIGECIPSTSEPPPPQVLGRVEVDTKVKDSCDKEHLHYVVPPGHLFAMGDNRDNSNDSRAWGSVPLENVKGKALFIWLSYGQLPPGNVGWVKLWDWIRFRRVGDFVQ